MFPIYHRLYLDIHKNEQETFKFIKSSNDYITSSDFHELYMPLKNDYGPINICCIINFCNFIDEKMQNPELIHRNIVYYIYLLNERNNAYLLNSVFSKSNTLFDSSKLNPPLAKIPISFL